ncbi:MAG: aldo/keto reductase [Myxococcota bacterium]
MNVVPHTDLRVFPLCLGGNVFGWTATEEDAFAVLDRYADAGGNFIDTADMYCSWGEGNVGGESEALIGRWMKSRGNRDRMIIATKVAKLETRPGLSPANIAAASEDSLRRLQTDRIDLYYAHHDDCEVPLADSLGAFHALVRAGKVRYLAASNYAADRLRKARDLATEQNLAPYVAVQPEYSLLARAGFEASLEAVCREENLAVFPYWALASGYLTGKYRSGPVDSPRADGVFRYADKPQAERVLDVLAAIAKERSLPMASVALAWCVHHPQIPSVIASARNVTQLEGLLPMATLTLRADEKVRLDEASTGT